jgi:LmbE family N-acetylglucosaminyl deacetylase
MSLRVLLVGAHPDDCDIKAGGLTALYRERGHDVRILSMTNGDAGHHELSGVELAERRRREGEAAAETVGATFEMFDSSDGELMPTLAERKRLIRYVREYDPDLLVTHRPNDYHPDHRYTAQLVRDAAYMVTVPNVCPETPRLESNPVIGYFHDHFEKPNPFEPDVPVAVDDVIDEKVQMMHCHESQMYEWLPFTMDELDDVPDDEATRKAWLREGRFDFFANVHPNVARRYRDALSDRYGPERASDCEYAEAIEISEYGAPLTDERAAELFPF